MTVDQIRKFIQAKLKAQGKDEAAYAEVITLAIPIALQELWNRYPWEEKRKTATQVIASGAYWFDAPSDCESVESIAFGGSSREGNLEIKPEQMFDGDYPNLSMAASGVPAMAKVVYNDSRKKTEVYFGPPASAGYTFVLTYNRTVPDIADVPSYLFNALVKFTEEEIYAIDSDAYTAAQIASNRAVSSATNVNPKNKPIRDNMRASIRHGRHIFNMSEDMQSD